MTDFKVDFQRYADMTERSLRDSITISGAPGDNVRNAAIYSLSAGGKRIRPVLCLAFAEMFGADLDEALIYACAVEMIHTFSLIHDDLPGMDNDDIRRGKPTCHKVFGEGMAILAGDALLNEAYSLIINSDRSSVQSAKCIKSLKILAHATGTNGMIGGQAIDIRAHSGTDGLGKLTTMYSMKTGALIKAPVMIAAVLAGVPDNIMESASGYAAATGLAFQIKDDILDVESTSEVLGKSIGKDAAAGKNTFVSLLGIEKAQSYLKESTKAAFTELDVLSEAGYDTGFIRKLTNYLLVRDN